jgi:hypothetical protein
VAEITEDLSELANQIKRLQIEWEKFFGGVERRPPTDLRARVENMIRRYAGAEIRNATERFRYQTLTARYNTFNELWNKRLRAIEEGRPMGVHGQALLHYHLPELPSLADMFDREPPRANEIRVESPELDGGAVEELYNRYMVARAQAGENAPVKFDNFQKLITQQTTRIITEKGAHAVDFRLETKDGKVSLKARPVK